MGEKTNFISILLLVCTFIIACNGKKIVEKDDISNDLENENIIENRDIFYLLFSDIKHDPKEYNIDYTIIEDFPEQFLLPEHRFIVKNDVIEIHYWPKDNITPSARGKYLGEFIPMIIYIYKNTQEYYLGKYIGKNIIEVINDFDNVPIIFSTEEPINYHFINDSINYIIIKTNNSIIIKIDYGYYG